MGQLCQEGYLDADGYFTPDPNKKPVRRGIMSNGPRVLGKWGKSIALPCPE
jgi:hypothetical protein